ncbi:MAG: hypothetical protein MRK01_08760 [Candidatus Scalindua sp.]|nr:hypothetical protein [Candidatus Scalindua sp.]
MSRSMIAVITILVVCLSIASCKKPEEAVEVNVESVEHVQKEKPTDFGLVRAMKKASIAMKRLGRGVKNNDWVEIDIWAQEIKEGIGDTCVELYEAEHKEVPSGFVALRDKFIHAVNNLILCSRDHDDVNSKLEFTRLTESCDECHAIFNEEVEGKLELDSLKIISPNETVRIDE